MNPSDTKASEADFERRSSQRGSVRMSILGASGHRDSSITLADTAAFDALISDGPRRPTASRRSSSAAAGRRSSSFGPNHAISSMPMVVDPTLMPALTPSKSQDASASTSAIGIAGSLSSTPENRSSVAKPPQMPKGDYLTLQTPGSSSSMPMPTMATSNFALASESDTSPSSGPSHPYGMYQQGINDTVLPPQPVQPLIPQGPSHSYGLYPQSIDPMGITIPQQNMMPAIPTNFGANGGYQRRIGPDGEESGLVGPFGHTEELPPYTRYPEQGHNTSAKAAEAATSSEGTVSAMPTVAGTAAATTTAVAAAASSPIAGPSTQPMTTAEAIPIPSHSHSTSTAGASIVSQEASRPLSSSMQNIAGAGGIGLATRDPEFSSNNDIDSPRNGPSRQSFASSHSHHEINTAARDAVAEKDAGKKPWQIAARKKVGGVVPVWALVMLGAVLLIMGVVLGAVIGAVVSRQKKHRPPPFNSGSNLFQNSIVPLKSIPANLTPLVIGTYNVPPLMAQAAPTQCINDTTYSQAWSCTMPVYYNIEVEQARTDDSNEYVLSMTQGNSSNSGKFIWGNQPLKLISQKTLALVNDTQELSWGPAWWFNMSYDKVVLISEDRFPAYTGMQKTKRADISLDNGLDIVPAADNTPTTTTTALSISYTATLTTTVTASASATNKSKSKKMGDFERKGAPTLQEGDMAWMCTWPGTRLDILVFPNQNNSIVNGVSSGSPAGVWPSYTQTLPSPTGDATSTAVDTAPTTTGGAKRGNPYPKVVKVHEQRMQGSQNSAVCTKMQILNDGLNSIPIIDDNNQPITVHIVEKNAQNMHRRDVVFDSDLLPRGNSGPDDSIGCACSWSLS